VPSSDPRKGSVSKRAFPFPSLAGSLTFSESFVATTLGSLPTWQEVVSFHSPSFFQDHAQEARLRLSSSSLRTPLFNDRCEEKREVLTAFSLSWWQSLREGRGLQGLGVAELLVSAGRGAHDVRAGIPHEGAWYTG